MNIFYRISVFIILFVIAPTLPKAQKNKLTFHYLTTDNGLSNNRAWCILRDSKNFVWIGTEDGLDKYNGTQLNVYRNQINNPKSITNNKINDIFEDSEKNIWVATNDGLNLYNRDEDSFIQFKYNHLDSTGISDNHVNCIFEDKQHNLWIGTGRLGEVANNGYLNKWNRSSKSFIRYKINNSRDKLLVTVINDIVQDHDGTIWLISTSFSGIIRFEPEKNKTTFYKSPVKEIAVERKGLFVDNDNTIWIATTSSGLFSFEPANNNFTKYNSYGDGKGTNGTQICNIIQEDNNNLLIAVDQGGLNRYNKQTKTFEYIKYDANNPKGLNNNGIQYIYKDKEDILWVATSGGGVNIYNPKSEKFELFRNIPGNSNSLIYNVVKSISGDSKGLIWLSTDGGGISVYNPRTGSFKNYKNNPADPFSLPFNVIMHTVEDGNHDYWSSTWDGGLIKLNHKTNRFTQYFPESAKPFNISSRIGYYNIVDHRGIIWLGTWGAGIDLIDPDKGIIKRFKANPALEGSLSNENVHFIYEDRHLNIWACTSDGVNLFYGITNSFKVFNKFPSNDIRSFIEDAEGYYWVGSSDKGLFRFKPDGTILKVYDLTAGLPNNSINGILEDDKSNLWVSTNEGISRINYKTGKIRNYTLSDGLQGQQFMDQSCFKTKSGEMYFGGYNGFNSFFPDKVHDNNYVPQVYINEFQLFNMPVLVGSPNSPLKKVIEQTKEIVLTWRQSVLTLGFIAINYTHPEKNRYAYKMEGFEQDWNYTDATRRYATYTNLYPGKYNFRVKASNNDGIWNEKGVSLQVIILPPWWKTLFFKISFALFILGIALGFYYYRINLLKKQKKILEDLVKERTKEVEEKNAELMLQAEELNDSNTVLEERQQLIEEQAEDLEETNRKLTVLNATKDKLFSIIAHDLKNPFSSILSFSEILLTKFQNLADEKKLKFLNVIYDSSQRVYSLLENLLQWARTQTGNIQYQPETFNLSEVIDLNYDLVKVVLEEKEITYTKNSMDNTIVFADRNMINTVIRNLLGNAIKYTEKGVISIDITRNGDFAEVNVTDSGTGISEAKMTNIFEIDQEKSTSGTRDEKGSGLGLLICKDFIQINGGEITVKSMQGMGTTFTFTIPLSV